MKRGVPISPGVAVARAYCVDEGLTRRDPQKLDEAAISREIARFDRACTAAVAELDALTARVRKQVGEDEAAIFHAHRLMLRDPALIGKVKSAILDRHVDAPTALHEVLEEYTKLFNRFRDDYLKERVGDLRDVIGRITAQLIRQDSSNNGVVLNTSEPVIVVAPEILPSQAAVLDRMHVAGIVTETGGATGHAAILARSLGIPAVSGLTGILREIETGDLLAIDGREGHVYLKPGPEVESAYRKLQREYGALRDQLIENHDLAAVSPDGIAVELLANVNGPADAALAGRVGAVGVGLYRTEYFFLTHPSVPTEEEQLEHYRAVIDAAPNHAVTIRTLDLGGDKALPFLGDHREANPFMGWRSIRMSTAYPEFFQTQLRAILRAALNGKVSVLFPMVSTLEEVQRVRRLMNRTCAALHKEGVPHAEDVPVGIMLEVPAAALCVDHLLPELDFVSIGSNDLIQYLMAADRDNPKVAHLCEPFNPALYRVLHHVVAACERHGKPVTLCGEMAARPRCFLPLFGLGLRRLSMSPGFVPTIKETLRRTPLAQAREIAQRVLDLGTTGEIRGYLTRKVKKIWPSVEMLDSRK
jgi:phosphoenolpyruvate-protein phosphotransferase (PTS system enzyme I)